MQVGVVGIATLPDSIQYQQQTQDTEFDSVAHLLGPRDARPDPDSDFFNNKTQYAYLYQSFDGTREYIDNSRSSWLTLSVRGEKLELSAQDLSTIDASDGQMYRHDGTSSITANGSATSQTGYYVWSDTDGEWKAAVTF
jgi:hypothetical protein